MIKRLLLVFSMLLMLTGCSGSEPEIIKGWTFQYDEGTSDYSLFFQLLTESRKVTYMEADVVIRIVNDEGEEVYRGTKHITKDNFDYYTSQAVESRYMARIRIPEEEIYPGKSNNGKVYFEVYSDGEIYFDEVNCEAYKCLPVKDATLIAEGLPQEVKYETSYSGKQSVVVIQDVTYTFKKGTLNYLEITISGEVLYSKDNNSSQSVYYKIYDSEGYVVDTGSAYLSSLSAKDKFRETFTVLDITPGETYTIRFFDHS
ncbi:MAG: hypothetical protein HUJ58_08260 [Erysipelotrichaceae bacterium]|nr:hypothetical protein [Erysipelotrichaceae bacterium]